jgi:hypothetical protein
MKRVGGLGSKDMHRASAWVRTKDVLGLASHLNRSRQGHRHAHSLENER